MPATQNTGKNPERPKRKGKPRGRPFPKGEAHHNWRGGAWVAPAVIPPGVPLYQVFRTYTEDAARLLGVMVRNPEEDPELRLKAASIILQRGWGDAPKALQVSAITDQSRAGELSERDILALLQQAQAALPIRDLEPIPEKESPPSEGDEAGTPTGTAKPYPSGKSTDPEGP